MLSSRMGIYLGIVYSVAGWVYICRNRIFSSRVGIYIYVGIVNSGVGWVYICRSSIFNIKYVGIVYSVVGGYI